MAEKFKIKKGDRVVVLTGKDKGKQGEVLRVLRTENRVLVQGVNMVKRHQRQSQTVQGGIVEKESALHISNVSHIDPKDDKPTRVGYKTLDDGRKVRVAKRSGEVIDA
ncbi:MAG: 50S ribosomal protein L24 [Alphaproteobacteria bacterium]|nr:50S ribosomal protein L24 [Alphaproteobacteria bacterium]MBU0798843.1 50S ribosomal protein L24 [Alphaproteobacteria bacterium]MBU0888197.1 50S ribosomal protein L24 [Alphaproteobacteria bacterium]MBU1811643.1 50S ribosomal protein L24 [Alphaproteobacteria bacterium]